LLLATLPQLLQQVLQARHFLAVLILRPLAEQTLQCSPQVAFLEEVVTHCVKQRLGVEIQDVLRPIPGAIAKQMRHGSQLRYRMRPAVRSLFSLRFRCSPSSTISMELAIWAGLPWPPSFLIAGVKPATSAAWRTYSREDNVS